MVKGRNSDEYMMTKPAEKKFIMYNTDLAVQNTYVLVDVFASLRVSKYTAIEFIAAKKES